MKLIDANIIIYAVGRSHPYKEPCERLFGQIRQGITGYTIDAELIQEVLYVYSYRGDRRQAFAMVDELFVIFPDPLAIRREELTVARRLMEAHPALVPRDAIHAAVVIIQGLEGIVTTARAFRQVSGLVAYDPMELVSG